MFRGIGSRTVRLHYVVHVLFQGSPTWHLSPVMRGHHQREFYHLCGKGNMKCVRTMRKKKSPEYLRNSGAIRYNLEVRKASRFVGYHTHTRSKRVTAMRRAACVPEARLVVAAAIVLGSFTVRKIRRMLFLCRTYYTLISCGVCRK